MYVSLLQKKKYFCKISYKSLVDLGMAIDPAPPRETFGDYNYLTLLYICHRLRHVSSLGSVTEACNIKIIYVPPKL